MLESFDVQYLSKLSYYYSIIFQLNLVETFPEFIAQFSIYNTIFVILLVALNFITQSEERFYSYN